MGVVKLGMGPDGAIIGSGAATAGQLLTANGSESSSWESPAVPNVIADTYSQGALFNSSGVELMDDDGTLEIANGQAGVMEAWAENEYIQVFVSTAGAVSLVFGHLNTAVADTDGKLCIYNGGGGFVIIKNRLGSQQSVRYAFRYA